MEKPSINGRFTTIIVHLALGFSITNCVFSPRVSYFFLLITKMPAESYDDDEDEIEGPKSSFGTYLAEGDASVSYTHLTLPTIYSV